MLVSAASVLTSTPRVPFVGRTVSLDRLNQFTDNLTKRAQVESGAPTLVSNDIARMLMADLRANRLAYQSMSSGLLRERVLWQQAVVSAIAREMGINYMYNPDKDLRHPCIVDGVDMRVMFGQMAALSPDISTSTHRDLVMVNFLKYVGDVALLMHATIHHHRVRTWEERLGVTL